ncbi:MAG: hypothetical protein OEV42_18415 [Deltaproteobacteria bacterium]|nr:hypothetical protein [Deltaproteobacteria bacterium]
MASLRKPFLCLLFFLFMASCSDRSSPEERQIRQVIKWYNEALVRVYQELDVQSLDGLTTGQEIGRVRMIVWKFKAEKKYMESEQKELVFKSISMTGPESADVETAEKWKFRHLRAKTDAVLQPWKDEDYTMYYRMAKMEGKWVVEKARLVRKDLDRNPNYINHSSMVIKGK